MVTQVLFPVPVPCLYHGSMTEHYGDGMVFGPLRDGCYRININQDVQLITRNRNSFTVDTVSHSC